MREEAFSMYQMAQTMAAAGRWRQAFLELWRAFDRLGLALLQARFQVGSTGSEMDRFALRRAVAALLPDELKDQALETAAAQRLLETSVGQSKQDPLVALLDVLFALHRQAAQTEEEAEGAQICQVAYRALGPLVRYLSQATVAEAGPKTRKPEVRGVGG